MAVAVVKPFQPRSYSDELRTNVRRILGYCCECDCGYRGPVRDKWQTAQWDKLVHQHKECGA